MEVRLGILSKFYANTGTYALPVWEEIDLIGDLTVGGEWEKGESTARRTRVKTNEPTLLNLDLSGNVRVDKTDDGYNLLLDAHATNETIDVMVLNGAEDETNAHGYRFDAKVFNLSEDQSRPNVLFREFAAGPCASDNPPQKVLVTAGVPVFSDIGDPGV